MSRLKTVYHFCEKEFYEELKEKKEIKANYNVKNNNLGYAYNYIFKEKNINNGNGMFFTWGNKENKGSRIRYCNKENSYYMLLELEVPKNICVETNYENWCSFVMDLDDANGDYELADEIAREDFGIKDGLEGSYNSIYDIDEYKYTSQILVPYIDLNWVRKIDYVENKIV